MLSDHSNLRWLGRNFHVRPRHLHFQLCISITCILLILQSILLGWCFFLSLITMVTAAAGCHRSLERLPREVEVGDTKGNEGSEGMDERTGIVLMFQTSGSNWGIKDMSRRPRGRWGLPCVLCITKVCHVSPVIPNQIFLTQRGAEQVNDYFAALAEPPDPGIKAVNILCPKVSQKQKATEIGSVLQSFPSGQARNSINVILPDLPTEPPKHGPVPASPSPSQFGFKHRKWRLSTVSGQL